MFKRAAAAAGSCGGAVADAKAILLGDSLITLDGSPVPPPGSGDRLFYPPAFHPSTLTIGLTVPLTIAAGEERGGIDFSSTSPGASAVRFGRRTRGCGRGCGRAVVAGALDDFAFEQDATTAIADANGAFAFPAVPAGHSAAREPAAGRA